MGLLLFEKETRSLFENHPRIVGAYHLTGQKIQPYYEADFVQTTDFGS